MHNAVVQRIGRFRDTPIGGDAYRCNGRNSLEAPSCVIPIARAPLTGREASAQAGPGQRSPHADCTSRQRRSSGAPLLLRRLATKHSAARSIMPWSTVRAAGATASRTATPGVCGVHVTDARSCLVQAIESPSPAGSGSVAVSATSRRGVVARERAGTALMTSAKKGGCQCPSDE